MNSTAALLFFLNPILWASCHSVTKGALDRFDPAIFAALDMLVVLPCGLTMLFFARKQINKTVITTGIFLGSILAAEVLTSVYALNYTTATNTGFMPGLHGCLAVLIAVLVLRQKVGAISGFAAFLSGIGAAVLIFESPNSGGHWIGDALALLAMVFFTLYIFAVDRAASNIKLTLWPCLGVQLVTMAIIIGAGSMVVGDWKTFELTQQRDIYIILYVGVMTTVVPIAISMLFQAYVSPIYVGFVYVLEPAWSAMIAHAYLGERLTVIAYGGGALVLLGALLNTFLEKQGSKRQPAEPYARAEPWPEPRRASALGGAIQRGVREESCPYAGVV